MKRTFMKLIAVFIAVIMIAGMVPMLALADAVVKAAEDKEARGVPNGYIPTGMHGANIVSNAYARGDMETYYRLTGRNRDSLPSSYNSNNLGYVTSVKNQNPYGSCWAHAAMASVESYMIKHNVPVGTGAAATTSLNLSETQHCFFNYTSAYDAENMLSGDKSTPQDGCLDQGGNGEMSAYTLQRWTGSASESTSALAYSKASTVASSGLNSQYAYQYNVSHVQNSEWIPATDIEGVKRAIMEYGAGNISYYESGSAYTYICTIDTSSQSSSSHKWANHAITLVGWDDSIAASRFSPNKPSSSGAWICKNSWGTSQFSQGYCYISYEDTSVLEGYIYFYDAEPIDNYDHNYQYDGSCNVVTFGKGWNSSINTCTGFANNTQVANVFTAKGSEMLKAIAYCNWDEGLSYTVQVYKNPTTGNPSSGTLMSTKSGTLTYSGYYTIPLDTPVMLSQGDTFSVVITQSVEAADENGYYIHTPYDSTFNDSSVVSWCSWTHANHGNTSYYKEPNGSWTDCVGNGDFRIKAYTVDYENTYTVTAVSNNTSYGTVSVTGTVITATPAAGYYVESCTVTAGTATYTINGNTINVTPSSDCTIRVNFAPKPQYTVSFIACNSSVGSQTAYVNDQITLPATCSVTAEGWTFAGWVENKVAETTTMPTYYEPGAAYTVTANATLYALYTRVEEGTGTAAYQYVETIENGGKYIIVDSNCISGTSGYAVGNTIVANNHYLNAVSVTINSDNTCTVSSSNEAKVVWVAASSGSGWTFYNEAVGKYMGLDSSEYLYPSSTALAWAYTSEKYLDNQSDSEGYYYLSFDSTNTRYTTNKSGKVINLYQYVNGDTTYYTTDPVAVTPNEYTVTFKDWDGTVLKTETVVEGNAATAPADPTREGYTFTGWSADFTNVTSDLIVTAQYTINSYTLSINYVKAEGGTAASTYTQTYTYGASYSVTSPTVEGYTPDQAVVTGTMGAGSVTITVTYTKNAPAGLLGDVNCDGVVDMKDVTALNAYLVNSGEISAEGLANADVSGDGNIDAYDSTLIAMIALGIELPN